MASGSPYQDSQSSTSFRESMDFIETAQYNTPSSLSPSGNLLENPLPRSWRQCHHPNGDVYFYNDDLRLITPDNIRNAQILEYVLDAREDHLQCLAGDPNLRRLPPDYELVISDVSDTVAVIRMYSRTAGEAYEWTEERGLIVKSRPHFWSYVAEFPSHHPTLPPNAEAEFSQALTDAKQAIIHGTIFPFSERQIDLIIARYRHISENTYLPDASFIFCGGLFNKQTNRTPLTRQECVRVSRMAGGCRHASRRSGKKGG